MITYVNDVALNSEHVIDGLKRCNAGVARFVHLRRLIHNSNLSENLLIRIFNNDDDNDQFQLV